MSDIADIEVYVYAHLWSQVREKGGERRVEITR
jgi:hypothetical protein